MNYFIRRRRASIYQTLSAASCLSLLRRRRGVGRVRACNEERRISVPHGLPINGTTRCRSAVLATLSFSELRRMLSALVRRAGGDPPMRIASANAQRKVARRRRRRLGQPLLHSITSDLDDVRPGRRTRLRADRRLLNAQRTGRTGAQPTYRPAPRPAGPAQPCAAS